MAVGDVGAIGPDEQTVPAESDQSGAGAAAIGSDPLFDTVVTPAFAITRENPTVHATGIAVHATGIGRLPTTRPIPVVQIIGYRAPVFAASSRRRAPVALRVSVVALVFIFAASLVGLVGLRSHRLLFSSLRHYESPPVTVPLTDRVSKSQVVLLASSPSSVSFSIPVAKYSIVVAVTHPCWLVVRNLSDAGGPLVARTILPSSSPFVVPVTGASMITIAAQAQSISVTAGKKTLEKISTPRLSVAYTFVPRTSP